jgi:2-dehydro-3-deoxyphosphogluconate aldolase/(4S)-4-hydroxy-2-oxoglutarate aldolase
MAVGWGGEDLAMTIKLQQTSTKEQVESFIEEVGIVPVVRASSPDEARFAAEAVSHGGIPIVEITMTVPGALDVISNLVRTNPEVLVGAGTVTDAETAQRCIDAGAKFLVSPGFDARTVELAVEKKVLIMAGALTPTEVIAAWKFGADFVKIFPCSHVGGPSYIKALKGPLPHVKLVPTGGVNLNTAADYIFAGAAVLGVGSELILKDALKARKSDTIRDLAKKFLQVVSNARSQTAAKTQVITQT